jgi:hypothetical protein
VEALSDDLARGRHDDASDERIGGGGAATLLSEKERLAKVGVGDAR